MIRINVVGTLSDVQLATIKFAQEHHAKSFSERNPELGRMINCSHPGCTTHRHRATVVHEDLVYATPHYDLDEETGLQKPQEEKRILIAAQTRKGILGAARFAHQRFHPHRHPRTLEVAQLTKELFAVDEEFAESFPNYQPDITQSVREAINIVNTRLRRKVKRARKQTQLSRRINAGLTRPGARP